MWVKFEMPYQPRRVASSTRRQVVAVEALHERHRRPRHHEPVPDSDQDAACDDEVGKLGAGDLGSDQTRERGREDEDERNRECGRGALRREFPHRAPARNDLIWSAPAVSTGGPSFWGTNAPRK